MAGTDPRIAFFDRSAPTWDTDGPPPELTLQRLDGLSERLGLGAGDVVLEVGCGTGLVTGWLTRQVAPGRVTAVDFSPEMLAHARKRGLDAEFVQADVCSDAFVAPSCDVVFCMHAYPHLRAPEAALRRFADALKPGGRLIVLHLANWIELNAFHDQLGPPVSGDHLPPPERWQPLLSQLGFATCTVTDEDDLYLVEARKAASP